MHHQEEEWTCIASRTLLVNQRLQVLEEDYRFADGSELKNFYVVREVDGVNIVALTRKDELLMVRQYRPAVQSFVYDFPSGLIEATDNSPMMRARIELLEETGFQTENWYSTGVVNSAPHRLRKKEHCFLALDVEPKSRPMPDGTERLTYERVPVNEIHKLIQEGRFNCGVCLASFLKAALTYDKLFESNNPFFSISRKIEPANQGFADRAAKTLPAVDGVRRTTDNA